jgi:cell division septum initiation protein DivIVA
MNKKTFLLEEMSKEEVRKLVKTELDKLLKDVIKDELEKVLKNNSDIKNQIGDISKDILKKLYKDLSLHHTYVIDRVKL